MTLDTRTIGVEPCCCGHPKCWAYWLTGIGTFLQGSGFPREEAMELAQRWNAYPQLIAALQAIIDADAEYKEAISPAAAAGIEFNDPLEDALKAASALLEQEAAKHNGKE